MVGEVEADSTLHFIDEIMSTICIMHKWVEEHLGGSLTKLRQRDSLVQFCYLVWPV